MADGVDEDSDDDISMTHSHNMVTHDDAYRSPLKIAYWEFSSFFFLVLQPDDCIPEVADDITIKIRPSR